MTIVKTQIRLSNWKIHVQKQVDAFRILIFLISISIIWYIDIDIDIDFAFWKILILILILASRKILILLLILILIFWEGNYWYQYWYWKFFLEKYWSWYWSKIWYCPTSAYQWQSKKITSFDASHRRQFFSFWQSSLFIRLESNFFPLCFCCWCILSGAWTFRSAGLG